MSKQFFQYVKITMSDGEVHYFGGQAVLFPGEKRTVANVEFTEPEKLPEGMTFENLKEVREAK